MRLQGACRRVYCKVERAGNRCVVAKTLRWRSPIYGKRFYCDQVRNPHAMLERVYALIGGFTDCGEEIMACTGTGAQAFQVCD